MGQTLTHGVYLPDEGERNCYNGLASNWSILDGSVGTIAEHTSALAGKAPAVHTHTKSDITDFPAYGNTAGTICEGNDSRLSDARTPVAHTHVTSDVTDLLNTSHEWSKSQTYSDGNAIIIKDYGVEIGNEPATYNEQRIRFNDKNDTPLAAIKYQNQSSSNNTFIAGLEFVITDKFKNGVRDSTGTSITNVLRIGLWNDGTKFVYSEGRWRSHLLPFGNNTNDIGSSSYQWNNVYAKRVNTQTLNGINPGALSLPDMSATGVDISGSIVPPSGETTINISGGINTYTATVNGWLCISKSASACRYIKTVINARLGQTTIISKSISGAIYHCQPVPAGQTVSILLDADSQAGYYFYPCQGNV